MRRPRLRALAVARPAPLALEPMLAVLALALAVAFGRLLAG